MRLLKRIVEFIFIFLVPLMLLLFGLKINKIYDENGNEINKYLSYENGIFREYKDNNTYINTLKFNQLYGSNSDYNLNNNGIIFNYNKDTNYITLNGTANGTYQLYQFPSYDNSVSSNSKVYISITQISGTISNESLRIMLNGLGYYLCSLNDKVIIDFNSSSVGRPYLYVNNGTICQDLVIQINVIDLTKMFGRGYEPSTINELNDYINTDYFYPYTFENDIIINSDDIISEYYTYNYTWYNDILFNLSEHLQFNNNYMIQFIFLYIILIFVNLLLWYTLYVPFDMLFGLLLRKLDYYK